MLHLCSAGDLDAAYSLMRQMKAWGQSPTVGHLKPLIDAYAAARDAQGACAPALPPVPSLAAAAAAAGAVPPRTLTAAAPLHTAGASRAVAELLSSARATAADKQALYDTVLEVGGDYRGCGSLLQPREAGAA